MIHIPEEDLSLEIRDRCPMKNHPQIEMILADLSDKDTMIMIPDSLDPIKARALAKAFGSMVNKTQGYFYIPVQTQSDSEIIRCANRL